jgi:hypothetical protein
MMVSKKWSFSSILLLVFISVVNAYMLAHPNVIGKLGILFYKHSYIKNFPSALVTVSLIVSITIFFCEIILRNVLQKKAFAIFIGIFLLDLIGFLYVYQTFTTFSYRITGKLFIYGAHLLPILLMAIAGRYVFISAKSSENKVSVLKEKDLFKEG